MNPLNRRQFLRQSFLTSISGLVGCQMDYPNKPYQVFWLHLEGAPLRTPFDLWIDPYSHLKSFNPPFEQTKISKNDTRMEVPNVWKDKQGNVSPLMDNLLMFRGLTSQSPHLKQCRKEWFRGPEITKLLKELKENKQSFHFQGQEKALDNTYAQLLGKENQRRNEVKFSSNATKEWANQTAKQNPTLLKTFSSWHQCLREKKKGDIGLELSVINSFGKAPRYFEGLSEIDQASMTELQDFYRDLIRGLEVFVQELKVHRQFNETMILITSDRARVLTNNQYPLKSEPMWQGLNFSLIGGALKGPVTMGHIARNHPKYSQPYPGTWGFGLNDWSPSNVHQLLADLCLLKSYNSTKNWSSSNPWIDLKPLGSVLVKTAPGKIF